jgi:mitotic spindle assembly checkpoint protein MAD2
MIHQTWIIHLHLYIKKKSFLSNFFLYILAFGINSILYQRGIYPPETFTRVQKYGLTLLVTTDDALQKYLNEVISQVKG